MVEHADASGLVEEAAVFGEATLVDALQSPRGVTRRYAAGRSRNPLVRPHHPEGLPACPEGAK